MEYTIISEESVDKLIEEVNNYIANGWQPQGGVAFGHASGSFFFLQAVVLEEEEDG
jgi:hypothetical protein